VSVPSQSRDGQVTPGLQTAASAKLEAGRRPRDGRADSQGRDITQM